MPITLRRSTISHPPISVWPVLLLALLAGTDAQALPSFSRQTGQACNMCHINSFGPTLTPYGRDFKLRGYVDGTNESGLPLFSGMVVGSFTNTQKNQEPPGPHFSNNNNAIFEGGSLFYAGKVWDKIGAFSELAYDYLENRLALENTDVRFANQIDLAGQDILYGITANNNPTVQDLWNTTPAWGFPFASSPIAATPDAATLIDGGLGPGQVGGASLYAMINQLLYVEAGAYTSFSKDFQQGTGTWDPEQNRIDGGAPYWRVALQHQFGGHYFAIGHYGLRADLFPAGVRNFGTDRYTDLAVDATYQFLGNMEHIVELRSTYIRENQELFATHAAGDSAFSNNQLNTFKANAAYTYDQTYGLTFGYNRTTGSRNTGLYNVDGGFAVNGKPDNEFYTIEADYVPFGKSNSYLQPWMNLRVGVQYVAYNKFNGTAHHAGEFNTLLLNGWLAF